MRVSPQSLLAICLRWPAMCLPPIFPAHPPNTGPETGFTPGGVPIVPNNGVFDPPIPKPLDGGQCRIETDSSPLLEEPPSPREQCFNGVELRYALCLQSGRNPALCYMTKVMESLMCATQRSDGGAGGDGLQ